MADAEDLEQPQIDSVADDVRAAFEQHKDVAERLIEDGSTDTAAKQAERARTPDGKFAKVEPAVAEAPEAKPITDADRREEPVAQPSTAGGPPTSWSADAKTLWSTAPTALQQAVLKREAEMNEGQRQWSEQRRNYEQAMQPVAQLATEYQMSPADAISRLVSVERRLGDPAQAPRVIAELAQAYGVNLAALANGSQQQNAAPSPIDPSRLMQTVEQRVNSTLTQWQQRQQEAAQTTSAIDAFSNARDASGKPAHEHFSDNAIRVKMGHLLQSGQATDMEDAYQQAIWATPDIRSKLLAAQSAQPINVDRQRADKAKKAAVSLKGAPDKGVNGTPKREFDSVGDAVRAAWGQVRGDA